MKRNFNLLCSKMNWEQVTRIWKGIKKRKMFCNFHFWKLTSSPVQHWSSLLHEFTDLQLFYSLCFTLERGFLFVLQHLGFLYLLFVMICWIVSFRLDVVYTVDVVRFPGHYSALYIFKEHVVLFICTLMFLYVYDQVCRQDFVNTV